MKTIETKRHCTCLRLVWMFFLLFSLLSVNAFAQSKPYPISEKTTSDGTKVTKF